MIDTQEIIWSMLCTVIAVLCVLCFYLLFYLLKSQKEAKTIEDVWWNDHKQNTALKESLTSLVAMVLKQAIEVQDAAAEQECKAVLQSLTLTRVQCITRLPIKRPDQSTRTKYFKAILADGNPVQ
jgi:Ca2+/Na+ antiporter